MTPATSLAPADYIRWAQRSFNRILGQSEITDGNDVPVYRDLIEMFQRTEKLAVTRQIHSVDQDRIVRLNHANQDYMQWVRATVRGLGVVEGADTQAIKAFQKAVGLGSDGWFGARTETALIANSNTFPPGHVTTPKPKPKPKTPGMGNASMFDLFLATDEASAKMIAPASIIPFPKGVHGRSQTDPYIRQRLAAAVRAARFVELRLSALSAKSDVNLLWNSSGQLEKKWFGDYSEAKFRKVLSTFSEIVRRLQDPRLKVVSDAKKSGYASALPGIRKIELGMLWVTPVPPILGGSDHERVQTFVHEAAHMAGRFSVSESTHYGPDAAQTLADAGMRATRNADNYGYYAIDAAMSAV